MSTEKCKCGSGKETTIHYYAGKIIGCDCPKCFMKNDDAYAKKLRDEQK